MCKCYSLTLSTGQAIAAGGSRPANRGQRSGMQLQGITQVVESEAIAELRLQQAHHVAPGFEGTRLILDACSARDSGHLVRGNVIANLT